MRDAVTVPNTQDLLELLDALFGHSSIIVASQAPIQEWHSRVPDPTLADAVLDRPIHNAHRLNLKGESQRKLRAIRSMPTTDSIILSRDRQDINQLEYKRRVSR